MEKLRILIVDDMTSERGLIRDMLKESFSDILIGEAASGSEAQEKLQKEYYDLVLCDWIMPGINGDEVLRWLRSHATLSRVPFIMVTTKSDKKSLMQAIKEGVDDYIVKPFTAESLKQKIAKVLNK